jgi:hypothetical protein
MSDLKYLLNFIVEQETEPTGRHEPHPMVIKRIAIKINKYMLIAFINKAKVTSVHTGPYR